VWRQKNRSDAGRFETYEAKGITEHMSFLEMLDVVNEVCSRRARSRSPSTTTAARASADVRLVINGVPHGPQQGTTTCQLHMRQFEDGDEIWIEPWRATAFPVLRDLVVDRGAFDRIIQAGGYVSVRTGSARDANDQPSPKRRPIWPWMPPSASAAAPAWPHAPTPSASLFVAAKVAHLGPSARAARAPRAPQHGPARVTAPTTSEAAPQADQRRVARMNRDGGEPARARAARRESFGVTPSRSCSGAGLR
jgi:succinate dehydrogenase / fumarate reductase iron-sulfur subunit